MALTKKVFGFHPHWAGRSYENYDYSLLSHAAYFSAEIRPENGTIRDARQWGSTLLYDPARAAGVRPAIVITNIGTKENQKLLAGADRRARLADSVAALAAQRDGAGVNIDFEQVPKTQRVNLIAFAGRLRQAMPDAEISFAVPAIDWNKSWDIASLAGLCDFLILMGYDFHWKGSPNAGPVAPLTGPLSVRKSLEHYLEIIAPEKLLLAVPYYGYDWPVEDNRSGSKTVGPGGALAYHEAVALAEEHGREWDGLAKSPWYRYRKLGQWRQGWFEDAESLRAKYALVNELGLGGVAIWTLSYGGEGRELWDEIAAAFS